MQICNERFLAFWFENCMVDMSQVSTNCISSLGPSIINGMSYALMILSLSIYDPCLIWISDHIRMNCLLMLFIVKWVVASIQNEVKVDNWEQTCLKWLLEASVCAREII